LPSTGAAYGGPHARVSSPLIGCSILITSALHCCILLVVVRVVQYRLEKELRTGSQVAYPRSPRICVQYGCQELSQLSIVSMCYSFADTHSCKNPCHIQDSYASQWQCVRTWRCSRCQPSARSVGGIPYRQGSVASDESSQCVRGGHHDVDFCDQRMLETEVWFCVSSSPNSRMPGAEAMGLSVFTESPSALLPSK